MIPRSITAIALLAWSAQAAAVGPELAFAKRGARPEIYLVNPDGTGQRLIYRGASKTAIFGLAIKPGGGEISFEEVASSGQTGHLKSVQYGESGIGTVVRSIAGCRFDVDYRAAVTDGSFFYVDSCSGDIQYVRNGVTQLVLVCEHVSKVAWLHDGESFLYAGSNVTKTLLASPCGARTVVAPGLQCVQWMRTAHQREDALIRKGAACTDAGIGYLTVSPPSWTPGIEQGDAPDFSSGDDCFVYITPAQRGGSYPTIRRVDGAGQAVRVGAKGNYSDVAWRRLGAGETGAACPVAAPAG